MRLAWVLHWQGFMTFVDRLLRHLGYYKLEALGLARLPTGEIVPIDSAYASAQLPASPAVDVDSLIRETPRQAPARRAAPPPLPAPAARDEDEWERKLAQAKARAAAEEAKQRPSTEEEEWTRKLALAKARAEADQARARRRIATAA